MFKKKKESEANKQLGTQVEAQQIVHDKTDSTSVFGFWKKKDTDTPTTSTETTSKGFNLFKPKESEPEPEPEKPSKGFGLFKKKDQDPEPEPKDSSKGFNIFKKKEEPKEEKHEQTNTLTSFWKKKDNEHVKTNTMDESNTGHMKTNTLSVNDSKHTKTNTLSMDGDKGTTTTEDEKSEKKPLNLKKKDLVFFILNGGCIALFVFSFLWNNLSNFKEGDSRLVCRWNGVYKCVNRNSCEFVTYKERCNNKNIFSVEISDDICNTMRSGQLWVGCNLVGFFINVIVFLFFIFGRIRNSEKRCCCGIFFMNFVTACLMMLAIGVWIYANDYYGSCYQPDLGVNIGVSNVFNSLIVLCLLISSCFVK